MDSIFKALADPTRRQLLDSLRATPGQSLQDLSGQLDMTRFGTMKHLSVLEEAKLVIVHKKGRFKYHYLNALPLQEMIDRWVEPLLQKPAARAVIDVKSKLEGQPKMAKPDFMMETYIQCTHDALWDALTDPTQMTAYHFVADRVSLEEDTYVYYRADGTVMLKTRKLTSIPKTRLEATFEPFLKETIPASRQVFLLYPEGSHMKLTVEHYDLHIPVVRGEGVADGWPRWAAGLKSWLETGSVVKFVHQPVEA
ncbi:MAG: helix-turn-helix domain-containing protein [Pseudomonadota bacterium]